MRLFQTSDKGSRKLRRALKAAAALMLSCALLLEPAGMLAGPGTVHAEGRTVEGGSWVPVGTVDNAWFYITPDGAVQKDCFSSDGYYVEANGIRFLQKAILNAPVVMRNSWLTAAVATNFDLFLPTAAIVQQTLAANLKQYRTLSVYSTHMMLSSYNSTSDGGSYLTDRLGLYKNNDINGYTIVISTPLLGDRRMIGEALKSTEMISSYDYEVLRYYTNSVTRCGDLVASAIYSHWMDLNEHGIRLGEWVAVGDTLIRYMPGNGKGLYEIKPLF